MSLPGFVYGQAGTHEGWLRLLSEVALKNLHSYDSLFCAERTQTT